MSDGKQWEANPYLLTCYVSRHFTDQGETWIDYNVLGLVRILTPLYQRASGNNFCNFANLQKR